MKYPSIKLVLPKELKNVPNGKLPKNILKRVSIGGEMWTWAAASFDLLVEDAKKNGIVLRNIGDYRPYERQLSMFMSRYSLVDHGRKPQVTRKFEGKTWYLKPKNAPSGTPGTSNHGMGLAIDLGYRDAKGKTASLSSNPRVMQWMCDNAPKYGFYLQGSDPKSPEFEAWHWQYAVGDKLPQPMQDVLAYLASLNPAQHQAAQKQDARQQQVAATKAAVAKVIPKRKKNNPAKSN